MSGHALSSSGSPGQILAESRHRPARRGWARMVLGAWIAIYGLLIAINVPGLSRHEFHDPDDQLRLQEVRDLIGGQGWFDLHQYRIDAADGGVLMHWSRIVDLPIGAIILALKPLVGPATAEQAALIIVPGMTLLAILALVGWMATRVLPRPALPLALLATAFAAPVIVQVLPARIDHHGWQIALALLAMAGFLDTHARRGGIATGTALATWMAISFEGLPFAAWMVAVLALTALYQPSVRPRLLAAVQALAAVSIGLFITTRGAADLAQHCDAIAPVHLAIFAWGALAVSAADRLRPRSRPALFAGLAAGAVGGLAILVSAAPQCTRGSFVMLDPVVRSFWYDHVQEGMPLWHSPWHLIAQYALPPCLGLLATFAIARQSTGAARLWWLQYGLVLLGALAIGVAVVRASAISAALAALPLSWLMAGWLGGLRREVAPVERLARLLGVSCLIGLTLLPIVPAMVAERLFDRQALEAESETSNIACNSGPARGLIDSLPAGGVLAPLDIGPDLLINTNRSVLATGHHRGAKAMRLVIDAFSGHPAQARAIMERRALRYVAICPGVQELALYRKRAPDGFAAQLVQGRAPDWLRPVPLPAAAGLRMWEMAE